MSDNCNELETIVSFCKRKGFIFPSSEIYGGLTGVYDLGPYGVELAKNIKDAWWKEVVHSREDVVGLDSGIFMSPKIWEASGHVSNFSDPLTECKKCHMRLRVDHLLESIGVFADEKMSEAELNSIFSEYKDRIKCPNCNENDFTDIKTFNLLVKSNLGDFTESWERDPVYLRGETCQGIYVNYKNVLNSSRKKVPFGIAQIGKAFRNEITPRQFIFRTREFEQMELQYFTSPSEEMVLYEELRKARWQFHLKLGIKEANLRWKRHEKLAFYAREAYDIEYNFPFGFKELEGVHARGDYDLSQHALHSRKDLQYFDPYTNRKYIPHVIESSVGVGRIMLALLCDAYTEEFLENDRRIVMKFSKTMAPVKVAIFPLLSNKPELIQKAQTIYKMLKTSFICEYDESSNIGKRYRRQDEIGTPYCVTIDFDTLSDDRVTIRDRDTMLQERIAVNELKDFLRKQFDA
jgi:glycyl-tRNA synthetase